MIEIIKAFEAPVLVEQIPGSFSGSGLPPQCSISCSSLSALLRVQETCIASDCRPKLLNQMKHSHFSGSIFPQIFHMLPVTLILATKVATNLLLKKKPTCGKCDRDKSVLDEPAVCCVLHWSALSLISDARQMRWSPALTPKLVPV